MVCVSRIQTDIKADDLFKVILKLPAAQTQEKALVWGLLEDASQLQLPLLGHVSINVATLRSQLSSWMSYKNFSPFKNYL